MSAEIPKLAVFKFASCDGCQLSLLACENELLTLAGKIHVAHFLEATSHVEGGPYDVVLVEGSITTPGDALRIQEVRRQAKFLVTIGACATAGGIQSLRNWGDSAEFMRAVYARPDYIQTLDKSTPIADHVPVDFEFAAAPSTSANCSKCSGHCWPDAGRKRPNIASASTASGAGRSA